MNQPMIERTMESLKKNGFRVYFAENASEARETILRDILPGIGPGVVSYGGSMTLQETHVLDDFRNLAGKDGWEFLDPFEKGVDRAEILERRRQALLSDLFLTGTNAVTADGQLVNLDKIGNRVGAIVWGPRHVILTVGVNKIVKGLDQARERIREHAAPLNAKKLGCKTPCVKTGICMDCSSPDRICNVWTVTEKSWPEGRISIVFIRENLGL